MLTYTFCTI